MKTYVVASLAGAIAFAVIVLGAGPDSAATPALACAGGWPGPATPMARQGPHAWLLRAMQGPEGAGTLASLPGDEPAATRPF